MQKSCQLRASDKDPDTSQKDFIMGILYSLYLYLTSGEDTPVTSSPCPRPEFVTVLADKRVMTGHIITLSCETNTDRLTATWEKKGQKLYCVEGKHRAGQTGTRIFLEIRNAEMRDEGNYTVTIQNSSGSASCSAMVTVELSEWRTIQWRQNELISSLKTIRTRSEDVKELRVLLYGPVGAGKSSIINTIKTIFEKHQYINCLTASELTGKSFTAKYEKFSDGSVPFAFYDVMGLEEGEYQGVQTGDIISALKGHLPNDYKFKSNAPINIDNRRYIHNPTLSDQIHCLVSVIPADKISMIDNKVIQKMKDIRAEASKLGVPQVLFLTRVDQVCTMTQQDVAMVYQSKKIREKMMECSSRLGFSMNCIFPVQNYSEETEPNEKLNCLMLEAFTHIVHAANDYVKRRSL